MTHASFVLPVFLACLVLALFGMPGCPLRVAPFVSQALTGPGRAVLALAIPNDPLLLGGRFCQQALVCDPAGGNRAGFVLSEAAAGRIGW